VNRNLIAPLTGVAFLVVAVVAFLIGGEPKEAKEPAQEIVDHYLDNEDAIKIGAVLAGVASTFLIFFGAYLRKVLSAAAPGSMLPSVVLVGTAIMGVGIAIDATISFAIAEIANDVGKNVEAGTVQTLQALWDNDFIPIALGSTVFLLSAGIAIVQSGVLPKWLGWIAILLAITGPTPAGFVAFLGGALWIVIVSVILALRARNQTAPTATSG
jgi:Domain of unknown function (DUF4386)